MITSSPSSLQVIPNMNIKVIWYYRSILFFIISFLFFSTAGEAHYAPSAEEEDESSLLDLFGESAKDFLTHRLIPTTDAFCRWHWKNLRCESHCSCTFIPKWGDYHLGRSCRKRPAPLPTDELDICHLPPEDNPLYHVRMAMKKVNIDLRGTVTLVKGEVCESWLSSAGEEESSEGNNGTENGDNLNGNGEGLPPYDGETVYGNPTTGSSGSMNSDGGVLSKPIRKLRKIFKCDVNPSYVGDDYEHEWMKGEGVSSSDGSDFPHIMVSKTI